MLGDIVSMPLLVHLHDGGTVQHFRGDMFPYAPQKCTNPQISARHPSADPPGAVIILPNDSLLQSSLPAYYSLQMTC